MTDIYENKEIRMGDRVKRLSARGRRRSRKRIKTFDEAVNPDLAATHRRRSRNSGWRRFRHIYKKPGVSVRIWMGVLAVIVLVLALLLLWDRLVRYPQQEGPSEANRELSDRIFLR